MTKQQEIYIVENVAQIDKKIWNELANGKKFSPDFQYNPFLNWHFFNALEKSGSATKQTGWLPLHLIAKQGQEIIGILPCYLKGHSRGEFVFDYQWAEALESIGEAYYPKLQSAVPFTPVASRRFLVKNNDEKIIKLLSIALQNICKKLQASSAHITFIEKQQAKIIENNFMIRHGQQFHWQNKNYKTFDDFLQTLNSQKRKTIKRERKQATKNGEIKLEQLGGEEITPEIWAKFFQFYQDTAERKWGQPYLTFEFFLHIGKCMPKDILLIVAKRKGEYIAAALNFIGSHTLFGRYWGCIEDHPFLHFETCYYQAIDYAIKHKLLNVEAGAQGGHKIPRGYQPQIMYSAHYIQHPQLKNAINAFLTHEKKQIDKHNKQIEQHLPFKKTTNKGTQHDKT